MRTTGRLIGIRSALVLVAAFSLGLGFSTVHRSDLLPMIVLVLMAGVGEWLAVRLGPQGVFTLRPVAAFVGLWIGGPALLMLAGLLPILLVAVPARRLPVGGALSQAGGEALGFWVGYLAYAGLGWGLGRQWGHTETVELAARVGSILTFWCMQIPLQALDLNLREGMRFRSVLRHLLRNGWTHVMSLSVAAIFLSYIQASFGLVVMGIASIVLIEAYYPWKLLGDQGGVLLTSLQVMAQAVDLKDPYTSNHSQNVARYAVRIAREMDLPEAEVERVRIGALMHDIGKIGISGRIIRKPGKLTPDEHVTMMHHSSVSANIIESLNILGESAEMVRHHHERWDGAGYPDGLAGEQIPVGSRIILVADAFDALTTDRPYRKGVGRAETVAILQQNAGTQFDRTAVDALRRIVALL
ncbi:MAG: HD-GYP domain-containing protein [bacterium]|nr:HD-GYP domain-containing protein [bacterium]